MTASPNRIRPGAIAANESGFTVLELVVAIALLGLVLAAIPGLLQMSRRAWQSAAAIERSASDAVVESFLAGRIAAALPVLEKRDDGALRMAFDGTAEALRFVAPVTDGPMGTGLFDLEIAPSQTAQGRTALVLHWHPFTPGQRTNATGERVLLPEIGTFGLRYFGFVSGSGRREWTSSWSGAEELPELIEVSLVTRGQRPHVRVIPVLTRGVP